MKYKNTQKGFLTLEILIAFSILILSMSAVILVAFGNQSVTVDAQINNEALYKAQKMLEDARATSRFDFNLVNPTLATETSGGLTYTKKLEVRQVDLFTKQATSTVSWTIGGRTLSIPLTTFLTNPDGVSGGTTCSSVLAGDWKHPQHHEYNFGQLGINGNNGNGFGISNLQVYNNRLYATLYATPNTDKDTFFIFDLQSDPTQAPIFRGSVDNSPTINAGLAAVAVNGNYAYVANSNGSNFATCTQGNKCAQLQVINMSNPASPTVSTNFKVPGVTGSAGQSVGVSIFYYKNYIYLGLAKTLGGPEFNVIDVHNPLNPIWKGGYAVGNGVNSIFVKDNKAYIATPNSENMTILDVTDPTNPHRIGGYSPAGGSNGESVSAIGNTVYLGRTFGTTEFYILNASNPGSISPTGSKDIGTGNGTSIFGLAIRDYLAFFITNDQFQVWNIANPSNITPWSPDGTTNTFLSLSSLGGSGTAISCEGNYFYMAIADSQGNTKDILSIISPGP